MKIRLEPVTVASRAAVERVEPAPGQGGGVESVAECLAEADRRRCWRPVGVYDGDALIGFAMYGFFWEYLPFGRLWLDRLLIDRRFQGRGYGRAALAALLERYRLANRDSGPELRFGILADLPDGAAPMGEEGAAWVTSAHRAIQALNEKYGGGFYLFFRRPAFSAQDEKYMGWERKRGALTELVRLL